MMPPRAQAALAVAPFNEWDRDEQGGGVWLSFHRLEGGFLLRFPDLADFLITEDGAAATCWPVPGTDAATLEHLFLNQVVPMMQSAGGRLVFHGGAVEAGPDRLAVAFLGPSRRGKSTLTASFAQAGGRFLTDDMLVLVPGAKGVMAEPGHPSVRMWCDSRTALLGDAAEPAPAVSYTAKDRMLAAAGLPHCAEPRPLAAAFFLGDAETAKTTFRPLRGAVALAAWMENAFLLDIEDRDRVRLNLDAVAGIARTVPSFAMEYPRRYDALADVRRAVLSLIQSVGETP